MPSLAKKRRSSPFHRGNVFAALTVIGVVALFFFLPELVPVDTKQPAEVAQKVPVTEEIVPFDTPQESIDSILFPNEIRIEEEGSEPEDLAGQDFNLEELDGPMPVAMELNEPEQVTVQPAALVQECPCEPSKESAKQSDQLIPAGVPLTWDILLTPKRKKILTDARQDATKLYRELPKKAKASRFEVLGFVRALDTVLAGQKNNLVEPDAVLSYLDYHNRRVSQAIYRDILDRRYALMWNQISLGQALESSQAAEARERALRPYNPQITATDYRVSQDASSTGAVNRSAKAHFRVSGFLIGEDTKRLWVYIGRDGKKRSVRLGKPDDKRGIRPWSINGNIENPRDVIILEAEDQSGEKIRKYYRLTPAVYRFRRNRLKGDDVYTSPFGSPSPRVDQYLRVRGGLQSATAGGAFRTVRTSESSGENQLYARF